MSAPRRGWLAGATPLLVVASIVAGSARARAEDDPPVFPGPPALTRHTKEVAFEVAPGLGDAGPVLGGGPTIAAFYASWLSSFAGATFAPRASAPRERWEARGGARLVCPEPLFAGVFGFVVAGGSVLFTAVDGGEPSYHRALLGNVGAGVFTNLWERLRLRVELREQVRLFGAADNRQTLVVGVALAVLYR